MAGEVKTDNSEREGKYETRRGSFSSSGLAVEVWQHASPLLL
jgi:hypothetical protein